MKFYSLFFFLFCLQVVNAQTFVRDYAAAEIHFHSGDVKTGYIYDDFAQNDNYSKVGESTASVAWVSAVGNAGTPAAMSSTFQTIIKTIHYKVNKDDGQQTDYKSADIDYITVNRGDKIAKYKTLKVKRVENEKGILRIDTLKREIWAPVLKEGGKINMYGYLTWENGKKHYWGEVYFKRADDDYAINLIKSNKIIFGLGSQEEDIAFGIRDVFRDCPSMVNNAQKLTEEYIDDFNEMQRDKGITSAEKKHIKSFPKEQRNTLLFELREKKCFVPYYNLIEKYHSCN
jgi:hypothetical protein